MIVQNLTTSISPESLVTNTGCMDAPVFMTHLTYLWLISAKDKILPHLQSPKFTNETSEVECFLSFEYTKSQSRSYYDSYYGGYTTTKTPGSYEISLNFEPELNNSETIVLIKISILSLWGGKILSNKMLTQAENLRNISLLKFKDDEISSYEEFKVSCEINLLNPSSTENQIRTATYCHLYNDLNQLTDDKTYADVTLHVGEEDIRAHKAILAARSTVFADMFGNNVNGPTQNEVNITGVEPMVLKEIIKFIYTGQSPKLKELADKLLIAADKYGIDDLKMLCEKKLIRKGVSIDTAISTLTAADRYDVQELKALAIKFINKNSPEIMQTAGWKELIEAHPELLEELYRALAGTCTMV